MGTVFEEFQEQLAVWNKEYEGRPKEHLIRLCLLALEREEIVSVAYKEDRIAARLARMPIPENIQRVIQHALLWAWKDEEMHTIYIRGAILRLGNRRLRARAFAKQFEGTIGGWASAVMQHLPWRRAPISRALASILTKAGSLTGRVPEDVRKYLNYGPFRDFCLFNVDAERTAAVCWQKMAELAVHSPELPASSCDDFRRVQQDEENHMRVFSIVAEALDDHDQLLHGQSQATLMTKIAEVGEFFVPRVERKKLNILGQGGRVWVHQASLDILKREVHAADETKRPAFRKFLEQTDLMERVQARQHETGKPPGDLKIVIKTAFMLGYHLVDRSALTDPELLEELAVYLHAHGFTRISVGEGRNLYDRFFANRSVADVSAYFGMHSSLWQLIDFTDEQVPHIYGRGFGQSTISRSWKEADFRIDFGKLRSHPVELAYLALGNMEGVGTRCDEFIFPERQAHPDTAIMMLLSDYPPDFALIDAYEWTADRILGMLAAPRPVHPHRFYGGADALAVDVVASSHIGVHDPRDSNLLRSAIQWFGDPRPHTTVVGCDDPVSMWRSPYHNEVSGLLSLLAYPVYQFSSGRGSMFIPEMDEAAFPLLRRANPVMRFARFALRKILGFSRPRVGQSPIVKTTRDQRRAANP